MDSRRLLSASLAVSAGVLAVVLYLVLAAGRPVYWLSVVLLGLLVAVCENLGESMEGGGRSTYGIIPIFGAVAALNTPSAMIAAFFGVVQVEDLRKGEGLDRMLYSGAALALTVWPVAGLYHALGGASRAFTLSGFFRSLPPLLASAALFWVLNTAFVALALYWTRGVKPRDFVLSRALRLLPNQLIYSLVGLGLGVIYAQNAFHLGLAGEVTGTAAEALRGFFSVACLVALLGVAWYYSGKNIDLLESFDRSVEALVTLLEKREPYLEGHAVRVADYAAAVGKKMRLPVYEINRLYHAALLHDLGRPAVPREVLLRKGTLTEEEFEKVRTHPLEGASKLEEVAYLSDMADAVRHHHEYYDGGGYVDHLRGDTIPLHARIIAVADAYEAMVHERPWRKAKGEREAEAELRQNSGKQFDPEVVEAFLAVLEERRASPAAEEEVLPAEKKPERAAKRKEKGRRPRWGSRRREELLRARREARERLEREAMRLLEEEGGTAAGEREKGEVSPVQEDRDKGEGGEGS
jgi:HD-GYP domain-containing protein (c-di-GMP phosphodiesterase class II)